MAGDPTGEGVSHRHADAIGLLRESGSFVAQAARAVGYSDRNYFYKVFKRTFAMTPSDYRNGQAVIALS